MMDATAHPKTVPALVDAGFAKNTTGVAAATKRHGAWIETSVEDFRSKIDHFALGLYDLGVRHGDRVALHAENSTEWLVVDQAVLRLGATTVPIYTTQRADQVRYIVEDSAARVYVVSTDALLVRVKSLLSAIPTLEVTVSIHGTCEAGLLAFDEVLARGKRRLAEAPDLLSATTAAVAPDDLASIAYTSGTTGQPKGVMLTHGNLVFDALASLSHCPFDVEAERGAKVLSYLPLSHAYERLTALLYLYIGYPVYFVADVGEFRKDIATVRPLFFTTVPRLLEKIHAGIKSRAQSLSGIEKSIMQWAIGLADRYDVEMKIGALDRIRYALADRLVYKKIRAQMGGNLAGILSGGAALPPTIMNFFNALGIFCGQGYGLTETSPVIAAAKRGAIRSGSVGRPLPGVEVAIADDGEILTRGLHVMKGYYKLPDETAAVIDEDGWFHTGDVGRLDEEGFLFITDRKKELFKLSSGKYIAPSPIESALGGSSFIEYVVVVGSESKHCSALLVLDLQAVRSHLGDDASSLADSALLTNEGVAALVQKQIDSVNAELPQWERIKRFRILQGPFSIEGGELTPTLKIKRRVVHEKYLTEIRELCR